MARIFMTGFEAGSLDVLGATEGGYIAISSAQKRSGTRSLLIDGVHTRGSIYLPSAMTEFYMRLAVLPTGGYFNYSRVFLALRSGGTDRLQFYTPANAYAPIRVGRPRAIDAFVAEGGGLSDLAWACLEIHIHADVAGHLEVKQDGTSIISYDGDLSGSINQIVLGGATFSGIPYALYAYYDDIAINDTTGTENNAWPGRGGIYPIHPVGEGNSTMLVPSTGDNWACVDEVPPNDADYVQSDTAEDKDTYALDASGLPAGQIHAVQWLARATLDAVGTGSIARVIRHAGIDYVGAAQELSTSLVYKREILEVAPNGEDWTIAMLNAIEAGVEVG